MNAISSHTLALLLGDSVMAPSPALLNFLARAPGIRFASCTFLLQIGIFLLLSGTPIPTLWSVLRIPSLSFTSLLPYLWQAALFLASGLVWARQLLWVGPAGVSGFPSHLSASLFAVQFDLSSSGLPWAPEPSFGFEWPGSRSWLPWWAYLNWRAASAKAVWSQFSTELPFSRTKSFASSFVCLVCWLCSSTPVQPCCSTISCIPNEALRMRQCF